MKSIAEVDANIDIEAYNREAQEIMELVKAGHTIKFVGPAQIRKDSIRTELIKPKPRVKAHKPVTTIESQPELKLEPEPEVPLPIDEEEDSPINLEPDAKELLSCMGEAQLYAKFCETALEIIDDNELKLEAWQRITDDYNNGNLVPELYAIRGKRTERSLRKWIDQYLSTERDMFALIHKGRYQSRGRKVTYLEQHFLLKMLLSPNKIKIGSAIATLKSYERLGSLESPSSVPTLKRWCKDWEMNNKAIWTQARLGSKAVAEDIVKTIMRDNSLLEVGQVWVADGHVLAFDIMNPKTGKAQRMTMIMVIDWASRYPVGASLAYTEDSQHIQLAFRNAFLNYGGIPKYVYLDNGKAFRSKLFNEKWQEHDLSNELSGIFPRLGVQVAFAESYNAKAKIIERFFKTFQERFERFISSFRGASVADKPATLMRNEKWARKLYERTPPTIQEAMQMIGFFIRYFYGESPHKGLEGKTPWQVYSGNPVPSERKIEAKRLNFLMLSAVRKTLRNNGIVLNKLHYWHEELMNHIGKEILIRYDLSDARWIVVYDMQDNYICQAEVRRAQDPFIYLNKDNPISVAELNKEHKAIKRHQRLIATRTKQIVKMSSDVVEKQVRPLLMPSANPIFIQPPAIEAPKPGPEQQIARLEQIVIHKQAQEAKEVPEPTEEMAKLEAESIRKQLIYDQASKSQHPHADVSL